MKRVMFQLHLWTGLTLGLVISLISLSGSAIVFQPEIDRWLNPGLLTAEPTRATAPLDTVIDTAFSAYPTQAPPSFSAFSYPRTENGVFRVLMKEGFEPGDAPFFEAMMHPGTGALLGTRDVDEPLVYWLLNLHATLLLGEDGGGERIVGLAGSLGLLFFIVTGLWLWWPGIRRFARGFRLRLRAGLDTALRDSHRVLGALALILLFLPVVSGAFIVFPDTMAAPVQALLPTGTDEDIPAITPAGRTALPAERLLAAAKAAVPNGTVTGFFPPGGPDGYFQFRLQRPGEPDQHYTQGRVQVLVNPYAPEQLYVRDEAAWPIGDRLTRVWMFPTHTGEIFGLPGRILIFLSGLVAPILFVTGLLTWARRKTRKAKRAQKARERMAS